MNVKAAAEFLLSRDNFLILCHANPDGDTLGSGYGLCAALQQLKKHARVLCDDEISGQYDFIKNSVEAQDFTEECIVAVDVADTKLLGKYGAIYGDRIDLCIDHHISNVRFAQRLLLDAKAAAAAEIIYDVVAAMDVVLTKDIAACLYTAIATDTGCFKFSNTTPKTHRTAAQLMEIDFGFAEINYVFFEQKSKARLALEEKVLKEIEFFCGDKVAMVFLTKDMLSTVNIEEANGLTAITKQIEGVVIGITVKEKAKDVWKASMRSIGKYDVQQICSQFGGGGHMRAAGCTIEADRETVKNRLVEKIAEYLRTADGE